MTVGQIIGEGLTSHGIFKRGDPAMKEYIMKVMEDCGLASYMFNRYPHQFSGGSASAWHCPPRLPPPSSCV